MPFLVRRGLCDVLMSLMKKVDSPRPSLASTLLSVTSLIVKHGRCQHFDKLWDLLECLVGSEDLFQMSEDSCNDFEKYVSVHLSRRVTSLFF